MARMEQYLYRSESLKVEIEDLEYCLLGPEELEVDMSQALADCQRAGSK